MWGNWILLHHSMSYSNYVFLFSSFLSLPHHGRQKGVINLLIQIMYGYLYTIKQHMFGIGVDHCT